MEVLGGNLDQIRDFCLGLQSVSVAFLEIDEKPPTRINILTVMRKWILQKVEYVHRSLCCPSFVSCGVNRVGEYPDGFFVTFLRAPVQNSMLTRMSAAILLASIESQLSFYDNPLNQSFQKKERCDF